MNSNIEVVPSKIDIARDIVPAIVTNTFYINAFCCDIPGYPPGGTCTGWTSMCMNDSADEQQQQTSYFHFEFINSVFWFWLLY
jgi:hypothetical protein